MAFELVSAVGSWCRVCGTRISTISVSCSDCASPSHADCWKYNGGCPIYGCRSSPYARTQAAGAQRRAAPRPSATSKPVPRIRTVPARRAGGVDLVCNRVCECFAWCGLAVGGAGLLGTGAMALVADQAFRCVPYVPGLAGACGLTLLAAVVFLTCMRRGADF
jgi:hypothetical protein